MIYCIKCSTQNSESRNYCRECGTLMVLFCRSCGFSNLQNDNYCGGCGTGISDLLMPERSSNQEKQPSSVPGGYSDEDLAELIQKKTVKTDSVHSKKEIKPTDSVSQDMLDNIFDATDDDD